MRFGVFVLIFCRQRYFRRGGRNRAEDRPILQDKPDMAVFLDQLREFGRHFFAVRALIVEIFDDRQIALGISQGRDFGIAQYAVSAEESSGCSPKATAESEPNAIAIAQT